MRLETASALKRDIPVVPVLVHGATMPRADQLPACASCDQANCLWGVAVADLDFTKMKPLVCGKMHQAVWGATGYEDPKHWCNLAKVVSTVR